MRESVVSNAALLLLIAILCADKVIVAIHVCGH